MFDIIPWKKRQSGQLSTRNGGENSLARLRDDFNLLAERIFGDWPSLNEGVFDSNWGWKMDVDDKENEFVVRAEAPGFEADDFDVQVSGNQLVIKAEQRQEEKTENGSHSYTQRSFHRSMTLPIGAKVAEIDASYKNGILELHLPKGEEAKSKRISVKPK